MQDDADREFQVLSRCFARLVRRFDLPMPTFRSIPGEQDVTGPAEVAFGRSGDTQVGHRTRHLFGHWLADLHAGEPAQSDAVADVIASLLEASYGA